MTIHNILSTTSYLRAINSPPHYCQRPELPKRREQNGTIYGPHTPSENIVETGQAINGGWVGKLVCSEQEEARTGKDPHIYTTTPDDRPQTQWPIGMQGTQ